MSLATKYIVALPVNLNKGPYGFSDSNRSGAVACARQQAIAHPGIEVSVYERKECFVATVSEPIVVDVASKEAK